MLGHALCHALSFHSQTITHSITNNQSYYQNNQSYRKTINPTTDLLLLGKISFSNTTDAIKLKEVPLVARESYPPEGGLPEDGLYQYLLQPGEEHNDQRRRATDRIWSKASYRLREVVESPGNRVMYYLLDGPERAFVSEELMLIPEDTELPPDYAQEW